MDWIPYDVTEEIRIPHFYSMFEYEYDKTYVFYGETHNFWECVYVVSGSICASADEKIYNMSAGEMIFHKPYELHKFYINGGEKTRLFIFSFSAEGKMCDYFCNKVFYLSEKQQKIIDDLLDYLRAQISNLNMVFKNKCENMYLIPFEKVPGYSQTVATQIYSLLFSLFNSSETMAVSASYDSVIFREAVHYMNSRICESPSVEEISKKAGISQAGLKRIFKKFSGFGVHKYFLKLKLKRATDMLESGVSVTDTAEKLGFSSQGYFTKTFKREIGVLPSELLKKL